MGVFNYFFKVGTVCDGLASKKHKISEVQI
jgi:hypothetical protein